MATVIKPRQDTRMYIYVLLILGQMGHCNDAQAKYQDVGYVLLILAQNSHCNDAKVQECMLCYVLVWAEKGHCNDAWSRYQDMCNVLLAGLQRLPQGTVALAVCHIHVGTTSAQGLHNHRQVACYGPLQGAQLVWRPAKGGKRNEIYFGKKSVVETSISAWYSACEVD